MKRKAKYTLIKNRSEKKPTIQRIYVVCLLCIVTAVCTLYSTEFGRIEKFAVHTYLMKNIQAKQCSLHAVDIYLKSLLLFHET